MQAFSNENIKDKLCGGCECTGFTPAVSYAYNAGTGNIVVTDASTYPAGDGRKIVQIQVYDRKGGHVNSSISEADGDDAVTVSASTLDNSEGLDLLITVVTLDGCISDGHASNLGTAGNVGSWDKDFDGIIVGDSSASS